MNSTKQIIQILLTGLIFTKVLNRMALGVLNHVPPPIIIISSLFLFIAYVVYLIWLTKKTTDFTKIYKIQIAVLCVAIATDLITFGFQKICGHQFNVLLGKLDLPFNEIDDVTLMWAFFRRSYPFIVTIGLLQMTGSFLLLFSKTRTLGIFILLPILITILNINIFYHLDLGVISHATLLIIGLFYLLLQDYEKMIGFFFSQKMNTSNLVHTSFAIKSLARFSILFVPIVFILNRGPLDKNPSLSGKYHVETLKINGIDSIAKSNYDSTLTRVYFDIYNDIVFDFNTEKVRFIGTYELNNGKIVARWRYPKKNIPSFIGSLKSTNNMLKLSGIMGKDSLVIDLQKQ